MARILTSYISSEGLDRCARCDHAEASHYYACNGGGCIGRTPGGGDCPCPIGRRLLPARVSSASTLQARMALCDRLDRERATRGADSIEARLEASIFG